MRRLRAGVGPDPHAPTLKRASGRPVVTSTGSRSRPSMSRTPGTQTTNGRRPYGGGTRGHIGIQPARTSTVCRPGTKPPPERSAPRRTVVRLDPDPAPSAGRRLLRRCRTGSEPPSAGLGCRAASGRRMPGRGRAAWTARIGAPSSERAQGARTIGHRGSHASRWGVVPKRPIGHAASPRVACGPRRRRRTSSQRTAVARKPRPRATVSLGNARRDHSRERQRGPGLAVHWSPSAPRA